MPLPVETFSPYSLKCKVYLKKTMCPLVITTAMTSIFELKAKEVEWGGGLGNNPICRKTLFFMCVLYTP